MTTQPPDAVAPTDVPEFQLRVVRDGMAVLLDCSDLAKNPDALPARIFEELQALKVVDPTEKERLAYFIRTMAERGQPLEGVVLVEGLPPTPPQHGRLEWAGDFFKKGFAVNPETGSIDYRQRAAQTSVAEGQLLARIVPPQEGTPGRNIYGRILFPASARPAHIRAGANVRLVEAEGAVYATKSGRVRWRENTLTVDEVFVVIGNVGLETGNITHSGAVVVEKDVEANARIEAEGDIEVRGHIEAADIRTRGNLTVRGGITGVQGKTIIAGGSVHARFILNAHVEAGEDIVVEREIDHSVLQTRGTVRVLGGRLAGGKATALGGFDVTRAGSDACVRTVLVAGFDAELVREISAKEKEVERLGKELTKIRHAVDPLLARESKLPPKVKERLAVLMTKASELEQAIADLRQEAEALKADYKTRAQPCVIVRKEAFPETVFCLGKDRLLLKQPIATPAKIVLEEGTIQILPFKPT